MDLVQELYRLGGVAKRETLVARTSRRAVDRALRRGEILRDSRGRYAVSVAVDAIRAANALAGVASHRSAAMWWGWQQKASDHRPEVTVPRNRRVPPERRDGLTLHWSDLEASDVEGLVTSRPRTLIDCLRSLPFDEGLAIADSALRNGSVGRPWLVELAGSVRGRGAAQCRRVAAAADGRAANPFESVLRSITYEVPDVSFVPQVPVTCGRVTLHPDLVDTSRRLVLEAESFEWHGSRRALRRDCRRYTALTVHGWAVLRFSWEDVMLEPSYVRDSLEQFVVEHAKAASGPRKPGAERLLHV
jgi:very-short-patch-repair endonuclease